MRYQTKGESLDNLSETNSIEFPKEGTYLVKIIRNSDLAVSWYPMEWDWYKNGPEGDLFCWTGGNFGCDCNRHASFERGLKNNIDLEDWPCGHSLYSVPYAILPDGTRIHIDE